MDKKHEKQYAVLGAKRKLDVNVLIEKLYLREQQEKVLEPLGLDEVFAYESLGKIYISLDYLTKQQRNELIKIYPPTATSFKQNEHEIDSPFKLIIQNPGRRASSLKVSWVSNDVDIRFYVQLVEIAFFIKNSNRTLNETESAEWSHLNRRELLATTVRTFVWDSSHVISWYGGDQTLTDPTMIDKVMKKLLF